MSGWVALGLLAWVSGCKEPSPAGPPADAGPVGSEDPPQDGSSAASDVLADEAAPTPADTQPVAPDSAPEVGTAVCGDGIVQGTEACDPGPNPSLDCPYGALACEVCDAQCALVDGATRFCGDGDTDADDGEACDPGPNPSLDCPYGALACEVCDAQCALVDGATRFCGDGDTDADDGEACDPGPNPNLDCPYGALACEVCDAQCALVDGATRFCGDGDTDADDGEACDPGPNPNLDCPYGELACEVCDAQCALVDGATRFCGDGDTDTDHGEACDPGPNPSLDCPYGELACEVCDAQCALVDGATRFCGDGDTDADDGEACDPGPNPSLDCPYGALACEVCDAQCALVDGATRFCGDGDTDPDDGEACDPGPNPSLDCPYGALACEVCDAQCALVDGATRFCGDGVTDTDDGEACDDGDDDDGDACSNACEACSAGVGPCGTEWAIIAESLADKLDLLPTPPASPSPIGWPEHVAQLRIDRLTFEPAPQSGLPSASGCSVGLWNPARISVGGGYSYAGEERCWVVPKSTGTHVGELMFRNRPLNSIWDPIVGDPAWVQARFPVPPGHRSVRVDLNVAWMRLFGSPPQPCPTQQLSSDGSCDLNTAEPWEDHPAGFYLLWSTPGAGGHEITGPHMPTTQTLTYSSGVDHHVAVPDALQHVAELVVTVLVYRQYPGGCVVANDTTTCVSGTGTYSNMTLREISLETRAEVLSDTVPGLAHPRIFGDDSVWMAAQEPFDALPCVTTTNAPSGWGGLVNVKDQWDLITLGAMPCRGQAIPALVDHPDASPYLEAALPGAGDTWSLDKTRSRRALHLIRRVRGCLQGPDPGSCQGNAEDLAGLVAAFKAKELEHLDSWVWCSGGFCDFGFDLWTAETMAYWARFVDVLWDELTADEHALLAAHMSPRVDAYLELIDNRHWAVFNGNNWTPVLAEGALAWAIAYYHEDPRAPEAALLAVGSMWLHGPYWKADGAYEEGATYSQYALEPSKNVVQLYNGSFGGAVHALPWSSIQLTAGWYLDVMATDGYLVDFGDGHAKNGWGTLVPIYAALVDEWVFGQPAVIDPCVARDFWAHKYYDHGLRDPWVLDPLIARDWPAILSQCGETTPANEIRVYPEGGWSILKTHTPGATDLASTAEPGDKLLDADKTYVAVSSVPNTYAHMEADFGTLVWTAYGSRLVADMGYGTQAKDIYAVQQMIEGTPWEASDNNPMGHSTLYVPEAVHPSAGYTVATNTSQIRGGVGTSAPGTWGDAAGVHLDGANVYGRVAGNPAWAEAEVVGWLESFDRWVVPIGGGHFLVADSFLVRADRPDVTPTETWQFYHEEEPPTAATCNYTRKHVEVTLEGPGSLLLEPVCQSLAKFTTTSTTGRILAASVQPGHFTTPEVFSNTVNNGGVLVHKRARYVPEGPLRHDARVFALLAAPDAASLPVASLDPVACGADACFELNLDGAVTSVQFTWTGQRYLLSAVDTP